MSTSDFLETSPHGAPDLVSGGMSSTPATHVTLPPSSHDRGADYHNRGKSFPGAEPDAKISISRAVSPTQSSTNVFSRLVRRTRSNGQRKLLETKENDGLSPTSLLNNADASQPKGVNKQQPPPASPPRQDTSLSHKTLPSSSSPLSQPKGLEAQQQTNLQPTRHQHTASKMARPLRAKNSIRDMLRLRTGLPTPSSDVIEEESPSPSSAYVPRHAASDFSRMALPSRPGPRFSHDEDRTLTDRPDVAGLEPSRLPSSRDGDANSAIKHCGVSPPMRTLMQNDAALAKLTSKAEDEVTFAQHHIPFPRQDIAAQTQRGYDSYMLAAGPREASRTGPNTKRSGLAPSAPSGELPLPRQQRDGTRLYPAPKPSLDATPRSPNAQAMSDYDAFLVRAEAEDRAYREQPMQFFAPRAMDMPPQDHAKPGMFGYRQLPAARGLAATGDNNLGSRGDSRANKQDTYPLSHQMPKRSLWGRPQSGDKQQPGPSERQAFQRQSNEAARDARPADTGLKKSQSLRRQPSIARRIAEYVRPGRDALQEDSLYRSPSKSAGRRGFGRTQAIETVMES